MTIVCKGGYRKRKGQYFLLFGFILLLPILYYIISFSPALSYNSLSIYNRQISYAIQLSIFKGFYSSLPSFYTLINEFVSGNDYGIMMIDRISIVNESFYNLTVELLNYRINSSEVNITLNNLSINYVCGENYCRFNKTITSGERYLDITINLKYFMNNELINTSKTIKTFCHNTYVYYYAFKKGENVISNFEVI